MREVRNCEDDGTGSSCFSLRSSHSEHSKLTRRFAPRLASLAAGDGGHLREGDGEVEGGAERGGEK